MAIVFADTNIVIEYLKHNDITIQTLHSFDIVYISDVVIMELYQGARNKKELHFIKKHISNFEVLKINHEIILLAKKILEHYTLSHNTKIVDALIAATVIMYDIELYTLNRKDFRYLKQINMIEPERQ
jgi:tRNA(fMet)-specific endonuclease VapC